MLAASVTNPILSLIVTFRRFLATFWSGEAIWDLGSTHHQRFEFLQQSDRDDSRSSLRPQSTSRAQSLLTSDENIRINGHYVTKAPTETRARVVSVMVRREHGKIRQ